MFIIWVEEILHDGPRVKGGDQGGGVPIGGIIPTVEIECPGLVHIGVHQPDGGIRESGRVVRHGPIAEILHPFECGAHDRPHTSFRRDSTGSRIQDFPGLIRELLQEEAVL